MSRNSSSLADTNLLTVEDLLSFFKDSAKDGMREWHLQELQRALELSSRSELRKMLNDMVDEGLLERRKRSYALPQGRQGDLFIGRLEVTSQGYGFVVPEAGGRNDGGKDMFISEENLGDAWDGDRVAARPYRGRKGQSSGKAAGRIYGSVVSILQRKHRSLVGTLEYSRGYAILRPDNPRLKVRVKLLPETVGEAEAGTRLLVKVHFPEDSGEREVFAEVEQVLGTGDDPEAETLATIVKYDLKDEFSTEAMSEAAAIPEVVSGEMIAGRLDVRAIPTFTIDGEDAKDFDDALSVERLGGRGKSASFRIGIHIADVSYYVAKGTALDDDAVARGTSVYLPSRVLPMLPEALSNGVCSLVEGEARLALSVMVDMDREGKVKDMKLREAVIQSDARLTYTQVQAFADGEERLPQGKRKLERDIKLLLDISQKLRSERLEKGALDFNFTEAKVDVQDGEMEIIPIRSNLARQLIEEFMLLANRLVAKELSKREIPALYRVHAYPSEQRLATLQENLQRLGYTVSLEPDDPASLQKIIHEVSDKPEASLINVMVLRSLKQAKYSPQNEGHFGLAFEHYLHFTSPIRRYPDLVVHRVVRLLLRHQLSPSLKERLERDFVELAEHTSSQERVAEEAERDLTRYFHARWAQEQLGEIFHGTINGVTSFGIFVMLPNGIEGLLSIDALQDDSYVFNDSAMMLVGKARGKQYRIGNKIKVKIASANPTARQIDFVLSDAPMPAMEVTEKDTPAISAELKSPLSEEDMFNTSAKEKLARANPNATKNSNSKKKAKNSEKSTTQSSKRKTGKTSGRSDQTKVESEPESKLEKRQKALPAPEVKPVDKQSEVSSSKPKKRRVLIFGKHYTK